MIALLLAALASVIAVRAHLRAAAHSPATLERARRVFALALMVQTVLLIVLRDPPAAALARVVLAGGAIAGMAAWWALVTLLSVGTRRRDLFLRVPLLLSGAIVLASNGPSLGIAIPVALGTMAYRWKADQPTVRLFRLALASLALAFIGFWGMGVPEAFTDALGGGSRALWNFGRAVRWIAAFHAAAGTWALLAAFVKDPSLGVRTVGRRLALSHVLVVTIPLLLTGLLWMATTVLGVARDRALVAARTLEAEGDGLEAALRSAMTNASDPALRLRDLGAALERRAPGARVWLGGPSGLVRVYGDSTDAEQGLAGWIAVDTLPANGVVTRYNRRWLGAVVRDSARAAVVLVPADTIARGVVAGVSDARVRLMSVTNANTERRVRSGGASVGRAVRDSLETRAGEMAVEMTREDSIELERVRRVTRRFGLPDTVVRTEQNPTGLNRPRTRIVSGDQSFDTTDESRGASFLLDGYAMARGVSQRTRDGAWRRAQALVAVSVKPAQVLSGLIDNPRRDQFGYLPLVLLVVLTIAFLLVGLFDIAMVTGMARGVASAIGELHGAARRLEQGDLSHRIEVKGDDDLWDVARALNRATEGLEQAREAEKERERIESELALARRIQARLLPDQAPHVPGLEVAGASESAREVGGDYFDHIDLGGGRVVLVIADVSGKGVGAALLMSAFRASLLSHDLQHTPVDGLALRLNGFLHRSVEPGRFVTAFVAFVDAASGAVQYVNAGHNPPLLLRADGAHEWLSEGGTILGILPDSAFTAGHATLAPGDLLTLYTDGVTEGADASGEMWGDERLVAAVRRLRDRPAAEVVRTIVAEVRAFEGETGPADDITMLVARRTPATPA